MRLTVFLKRHFLFLKERAVLWNMMRTVWFILDISSYSEVVWCLFEYALHDIFGDTGFSLSLFMSLPQKCFSLERCSDGLLALDRCDWIDSPISMMSLISDGFITWYLCHSSLDFRVVVMAWTCWTCIMSFDSMNNKGRFFPLEKKKSIELCWSNQSNIEWLLQPL